MSEQNLMYEITQKMTDQTAVQRDMGDAMNLLQNFFQERYISKFNTLVQEHQNKIMQKPSKEVGLMQAFKPFMPEERHEDLERMINMLVLMDTFQSVRQEMGSVLREQIPAQVQNIKGAVQILKDDSIHEDGIYDVDFACMHNKKASSISMVNLMMFMAFGGMR